jgi:hypothetical protein
MKMHQLATRIGGTVRGVFTDTIIFEGEVNKPKCNKDIIGGIRSTGMNDFTKCIYTMTRLNKYIVECPKLIKLTKIEEFKLDDDKGCLLQDHNTGEPGRLELVKPICVKDYKMNYKITKDVDGTCFKVCKTTHKSALIANATTILIYLIFLILLMILILKQL